MNRKQEIEAGDLLLWCAQTGYETSKQVAAPSASIAWMVGYE